MDEEIVFELDNISNYTLDITQNKLIIKKQATEINFSNFKNYDYKFSNILECKINNIDVIKLSFQCIIVDLWKYLLSIDIDYKDLTTLKIGDELKDKKKINYNKDLDIYFYSKNALGSLSEIFHLVNKFNIDFYIKLELKDKKIIYFKNDNFNEKTYNYDNEKNKCFKLKEVENIELTAKNIDKFNFDNSNIKLILINDNKIISSYLFLIYYLLDLCEKMGYNIYKFNFIEVFKFGCDEYDLYSHNISYNSKFRIKPLDNKNIMNIVLNILDLIHIDFKIEIELENKNILYLKKENKLQELIKLHNIKNIHLFINRDLNENNELIKYHKDYKLEEIINILVNNNLNIAVKKEDGEWYLKNKKYNIAYDNLSNSNKFYKHNNICYLIEY